MSDVSAWNPLDESNTAAPPDGWPEFMQPSMVNNTGRMMMGAVRRMYDGLAAGSLVLPYLKLAGGQTVTGAVTFSAGLTASAITSNGTINAVSTISTSGAISASGNVSGGSISTGGALSAGTIAAGNTVVAGMAASYYDLTSAALARVSGSSTLLYDRANNWCLNLDNGGDNTYANVRHVFNNRGSSVNYGTWGAGGINTVGGVACGGMFQGGSLSVSGGISGNTVTAAGQITSGGALVANGRSVYAGPSGEATLLHNDGGNRKYVQFHPSSAIVLQLENSNIIVSSASLESWFMHPYGCGAMGGPVSGHGPYSDVSDASLKEQIEPAPQGLAEILALKPVTFVRKPRAEGAPQRRQELGFIAQDVQQALPLAVVEVAQPGGTLLGVASTAIVAALVTALKQIDERLKAGGL